MLFVDMKQKISYAMNMNHHTKSLFIIEQLECYLWVRVRLIKHSSQAVGACQRLVWPGSGGMKSEEERQQESGEWLGKQVLL